MRPRSGRITSTYKCSVLCITGSLDRAQIVKIFGEVSEWLKEHAWKVCIRQRIEGSNPSLSANKAKGLRVGPFAFSGSGSVDEEPEVRAERRIAVHKNRQEHNVSVNPREESSSFCDHWYRKSSGNTLQSLFTGCQLHILLQGDIRRLPPT